MESTSPSTYENFLAIQLLDWGNDIATCQRQYLNRLFWLKQVSLRNYEFSTLFTEQMQRDFYSVTFIICLKLFSNSYEQFLGQALHLSVVHG